MSHPPHLLLIGSKGMLGRAWVRLLTERQFAFRTIDRDELDLTEQRSIERNVRPGPEHVINCAAWTDVDGAETHEPAAAAVNGVGVGLLAERCRAINATLVHYSTDYVFDGQGRSPYPTDGPISPINAYGRTKADGERRIRESGTDHLIVRTSWLYAPWANNFVRTMARLGRSKPRLRVVHDQRGRPTSCEHLASASWRLLNDGVRGTYHVCDGGECTWYEFARAIVAEVNPDCMVEPCTTAEFPRPAPRPAYSTLDLTGTETHLGPMPPWQDHLKAVMQRLEPDPT